VATVHFPEGGNLIVAELYKLRKCMKTLFHVGGLLKALERYCLTKLKQNRETFVKKPVIQTPIPQQG